jgi:Protein of unknown function (DUF1574)
MRGSTFKQWKRHNRRAAFWLAGAFAASQLILAAVIDQGALNIRDPEYVLLKDKLRDRKVENPDKPLAMFLGSSRVAHGFDAARSRGDSDAIVFNFGIPGSGPYLQTIILDRLAHAGIHPDILFLEVLHPFYNGTGPRSLDHSLLDGARLSAGEASGLLNYGTPLRTGPLRRWFYARALPINRHQAELRDVLQIDVYQPGQGPAPPFEPIDPFGYRPREVRHAQWPDLTGLAHQQYDAYFARFQLDPAPWGRLLMAIDQVRGAGGDVAVVLMPEATGFRKLYAPECRDGIAEMIRRLREEVGVTVVDARDWVEDSGFYDHHHLLPAGAAAFADRFHTDALVPVLERRAKPRN